MKLLVTLKPEVDDDGGKGLKDAVDNFLESDYVYLSNDDYEVTVSHIQRVHDDGTVLEV